MAVSRRIRPDRQRVVKLQPSLPPARGEVILVDGARHRVTACRVRWDGLRWTIRKLKARPL